MNVYDTERMVDLMSHEGYVETDTPDDADLVVLNTCHIREKAAEKVYSDIGRIRKSFDKQKEKNLLERKNSTNDKIIAVAGCVAQAEGAEIMKRAPIVDMVFGPQTYHKLPDMVAKAADMKDAGQQPRLLDTDLAVDEKFDFLSKKKVEKKPSAFLTIQEGCDKFCTFCVVPYTRGAEYSRTIEDVMADAKKLQEAGVVEVTMLGQNVNGYHGVGADGNEWTLPDLIRKLAKIEGFERLRYTTSHPHDMTDDLIRVHGEVPELMPYLHLPVQAGSDKILKAMNRTHTSAEYLKILEDLRQVRPDIALSGDFIVGFPGETDADFKATMKLIREVEYAQAYSFKYSTRPGTPAADMVQVEEHVKAERLAELQELLTQQQMDFNKQSEGQTMRVLMERFGKRDASLAGRSPYMQAVHVNLPSQEMAEKYLGKLVDIYVTNGGARSLRGDIVGLTQNGVTAA
jgi:tRNA-2-methylthio-N6-dimethylallyladenosine synthase